MLSGGVGSALTRGNFWEGVKSGGIALFNHAMHKVSTSIEYQEKLTQFLKDHCVDPSAKPTQAVLDTYKTIFKEYWNQSAPWAEFADGKSIARWEKGDGSKLSVTTRGTLKLSTGGSADRDKGEYKTFNGGEYCYDCLMQSNKEEKTISIQVDEHKVDFRLNNKYNFMSAMEHEGSAKTPSHFTVNVRPRDTSTTGQRNEHLKIYNYQTTQSSFFKKTTPEFQKLINKNYKEVKNGATGN